MYAEGIPIVSRLTNLCSFEGVLFGQGLVITAPGGEDGAVAEDDGAGDVDKLWHAFHRRAVDRELNGQLANTLRGHGDDACLTVHRAARREFIELVFLVTGEEKVVSAADPAIRGLPESTGALW